MSIELNLLDKLKYRVQLARKIETTQHKIKKANHDRNWMKETAKAMELELDSDFVRYTHVLHAVISAPTPSADVVPVTMTRKSHRTKFAKQRTTKTLH
jgi:hypothetical protein